MIIEADSVQIPFSAVKSARRVAPYPERYGQKNIPRVLIEYGEGETASTSEHVWVGAMRETLAHMVPAQPGTWVLFPNFDCGKFHVIKTPVIAWGASLDGSIYPVTYDGVNDGGEKSLPVLHPDGTVVQPHDGQFATYEDWEADAEKEARERAERRQANAKTADDQKEVER